MVVEPLLGPVILLTLYLLLWTFLSVVGVPGEKQPMVLLGATLRCMFLLD